MGGTANRILVGTRKGLVEARRGDSGWTLAAPALRGIPVSYAVHDARTNTAWACLDHGHWGVKLAKRVGSGDFDEVAGPKYPESTAKAVKYYWVLQPGHADRPETLYVGTEPGGLFESTDGGASWALNEPLWERCVEEEWEGGGRDAAGIHSICVDPRDPDHVYVGISIAGVVETKDGGKTWAHRNEGQVADYMPEDQREGMEYGFDPHCLAMVPSSPDILWQANHCGVFRTTSGGARWDNLSQKPWVYFGFPIAVHPQNAETAWIVPMESAERRTTIEDRLVVSKTDDGGRTWTHHDVGLPRTAWDFPYRHGLDVAADGETLAFGTTSGNLYLSTDGGVTWESLSHNLPAIYSVRFA